MTELTIRGTLARIGVAVCLLPVVGAAFVAGFFWELFAAATAGGQRFALTVVSWICEMKKKAAND